MHVNTKIIMKPALTKYIFVKAMFKISRFFGGYHYNAVVDCAATTRDLL
jgi:hypothetical protein